MDVAHVSCCTYALVHRSAEEPMKIVADARFKKIDLLGKAPHLSLDPSETDLTKIKLLAQTHGLQIANLGTYVGGGFTNPDPAIQAREFTRVQRAIDPAVFFVARSIRFFSRVGGGRRCRVFGTPRAVGKALRRIRRGEKDFAWHRKSRRRNHWLT